MNRRITFGLIFAAMMYSPLFAQLDPTIPLRALRQPPQPDVLGQTLNVMRLLNDQAAQQAAQLRAQRWKQESGGESVLLLFGGADHKTFLGCLTCNAASIDSPDNKLGPKGSPFSTESVWNQFSPYGSLFSQYSACNELASDPPVIVDLVGKFYGRLTLNSLHPQIGLGSALAEWLRRGPCK